MFTPEKLLEIAVANYAIYKAPGPGIPRTSEQMDAHRLAEQAETCALWLERFGNGEAVETIGPFGAKKIESGDVVKVKKGAVLYTTHPKYKRTYNPDGSSFDKIAGKDYEVKVHNVDNGWAPGPHQYHDHKLRNEVRNQKVHWAGEGGYWFWTDAQNVEVIS
jgi:hypothetical protein